MVRGSKGGQMAHFTKVNGTSEKPMERASCIMQTVTFMKEIGLKIRPMVTEHILTQMAQNTLEAGRTINSMGSGLRLGLMVLCTRASIKKERSTALEN